MKILHSADWHIGNFKGPEKNGQNVRLLDTLNCLDFLVKKAKEEKPDIVLVSGDIYHQAKVWADRGLRETTSVIEALNTLGCVAPTVVMRGTPNHDGAEHFEALKTVFESAAMVHIVDVPEVLKIHTKAGAINVAVLPGFDRGYYRAQNPGLSKEEENDAFTEALANMVIGLKAQCDPAFPSVLMSHYTVPGCVTESGQIQFMQQFEPVLTCEALNAAEFDLVALGHIHRPQQVENAKNTFYCGAINGLTFNDEGQDRGFYIHELGETLESRYIVTPSRKFFTVSMDDNQVKAFEELGDLFAIPGIENVEDAIVRVIYSCTDEHNKAFNKPRLEKYLYNKGAFYVQEIKPEKIYITTNKEALNEDNTPEELLIQYLKERELAPDKLTAIVELARPIIAKAVENHNVAAMTGTFVPVEIEVKNYRNYKSEVFNYENITFATINGPNGVGKSSLFMDAMLDCLYEDTREGELTGWISNDEAARSGMIKFTFKIGDKVFRVTRTRQKSGKATLNISELVGDEWLDRSKEKYKDTQEVINNVVGMDSLMLRSCGLIMQDQYGLFLQADKEARMTILGNILGLGLYGDMEDNSHDKALECNRMIKSLQDKISEITGNTVDIEEVEAKVKECESQVANNKVDLEALTSKADVVKVQLNTKADAAARAAKLQLSFNQDMQKKESLEGSIAAKKKEIDNANLVLSQEENIKAGIEAHNRNLEAKEALLSKKGLYDVMVKNAEEKKARAKEVESEINASSSSYNDEISKRNVLRDKLSNIDILKAEKAKYDALKIELEEAESKADLYNGLLTKVNAAKSFKNQEISSKQYEYNTMKLTLESAQKSAKLLDSPDLNCPVSAEATCKFLKEAVAAKACIPEREKLLATMEADIKALTEKHDNIIQELEAKCEALNFDENLVKTIKTSISTLEADLSEYEAMEAYKEQYNDICATVEKHGKELECLQTKLLTLKAEIEEADKSLESMAAIEEEYKEIENKILLSASWLDKDKMLPVAAANKENAENRIKELTADLDALSSGLLDKLSEIDKEKEAATGGDNLKEELSLLEEAIQGRNATIEGLNMDIGRFTKLIEDAEEAAIKAQDYTDQVQELSIKAAGYELLMSAFCQDGIPHNIIRTILPVFEATATNILGQMSGGKMAVEIVPDKVLKSNKKKEVTTLDIIINDYDTGRLPYMSRSGGERVKASLSVILALAEIKASKVGVQLGFLFIDEPPFLDAPGVEAYCDALEAIQTRYSSLKVMAITHDPQMKSRFPQSIDVIKTPDGSKVARVD